MHFSPKTHVSLFSSSARRKSLAQGEESEETLSSDIPVHPHYAGLQPSASTSWINPFAGRASFSVEDDTYRPPAGSLPSSCRPSAATVITALLRPTRMSTDGYTSSDDAGSSSGSGSRPSQTTAATTVGSSSASNGGERRRPSIFKAWKARRTSHSTQGQQPSSPLVSPPTSMGYAQGRRKSSALTRVLAPQLGQHLSQSRVDEHSISDGSDSRRRSLSIVCRGERESEELDRMPPPPGPDQTPKQSEVTAAMAIRDTWLYGAHQWNPDGRKGSISTVATSPSHSQFAAPRKSISARSAVGLDTEDQQLQHQHLQQRLRQLRRREGNTSGDATAAAVEDYSLAAEQDDAESVVSLSLTEEIALYTTDVQTVEHNTEMARRRSLANGQSGSGGNSQPNSARSANGAFMWSMPDWNPLRLPELSPAPQVLIADPFAVEMQRVESGSLDPVLSPIPAYSPTYLTPEQGPSPNVTPVAETAEAAAIQWNQPQWNAASPFRPDATVLPTVSELQRTQRGPSYSGGLHYTDESNRSPTAPNFPEEAKRRATTYYDASPLPVLDEIPGSPATKRQSKRPTSSKSGSPKSGSPKSPRSPRTFGTSESSYELNLLRSPGGRKRNGSYSLPRPPPGYEQMILEQETREGGEEEMPTPRLVSGEFGEASASPLSSIFAPETPSNVVTNFPDAIGGEEGVKGRNRKAVVMEGEEQGDDLHEQFCSVLLLDLGNGTALPLMPSPGTEDRPDPFMLLAH